MEKEKIVRRKYILDKPFQFGYVIVMILLQLCVAVVVILVGFSSLVLIIWGLVYSHRIIAPIHRMRILLRSAASGDIPSGKIAFRKNDCFKGLEDDLTSCLETMERYRQGWVKDEQKS
ncbi:MAG: hypothetical protein JRI65_11000 [Deltaproteobacteria bacterium]|nr:hypothetical protein [Deltaproteobacteria bacterium]